MKINIIKDEYLYNFLKTVVYENFDIGFNMEIEENFAGREEILNTEVEHINSNNFTFKNDKILNILKKINRKENKFIFNIDNILDYNNSISNEDEFLGFINSEENELNNIDLSIIFEIEENSKDFSIKFNFDEDKIIERYSYDELFDEYTKNNYDNLYIERKRIFIHIKDLIKTKSLNKSIVNIDLLNDENLLGMIKIRNFTNNENEISILIDHLKAFKIENLDLCLENEELDFEFNIETSETDEELKKLEKLKNDLSHKTKDKTDKYENFSDKMKELEKYKNLLKSKEPKKIELIIKNEIKLKLEKTKELEKKRRQITMKNQKNRNINILEDDELIF